MGSKKQLIQTKKFRFNKNFEIGSPDAETDRILFDVFVENDALQALIDTNNQKSIIIGRTGSGKSALLKYIEVKIEHSSRIEPESMSLRFLSNSNILRYFERLEINLNFFYKVLWKHVFIIELLKLYFGEDLFKKQNFLESIADKFRNKSGKASNAKKEQAIQYLKKWSNEFWLYTEYRIKELEKNIETSFVAESGISIQDLILKLKSGNKESDKTITDIKYKAEKVINESQAAEIHEIINIMREEIFINHSKRYYLIIDDLDKEWIPSTMRYNLIGAMIEVIKEFQLFSGVKIIIALRDNLYQLVFAGFKHKGGQREKFKPLYVNLEWEISELEELVEKRLSKITDNAIKVKDAFNITHNDKSGFQYMLERTFQRPRDIISFVNHAIENANNKSYFSLDIIKKAEIYYSKDRLQAIEDEWGENFGDVHELFTFLIGKYNGFRLKNIKEEEFIHIYLGEDIEKKYKGDLLNIIKKWKNDDVKFGLFIKEILFILYNIGIVGIKRGPTFSIQFFYEKDADLGINDITNDAKIYVHKAFYSVLKINTKEQDQDTY